MEDNNNDQKWHPVLKIMFIFAFIIMLIFAYAFVKALLG